MRDLLRIRSRQQGAVFVELAFGLPLFLGVIFLVLWMASIVNGRFVATSALLNATRLAVTRGALEDRVGQNLINDVKVYRDTGDISAKLKDLLLFSPESDRTIEQAVDFYNQHTISGLFPGETLQTIPAEYLYAIAYANQSFRVALGPAVRFPCSATDETATLMGGEATPKCLELKFLHPYCMEAVPYNNTSRCCDGGDTCGAGVIKKPRGIWVGNPPATEEGAAGSEGTVEPFTLGTFPRGILAMRASYRFDRSIVDPLIKMMSILAPGSGAASDAFIVSIVDATGNFSAVGSAL